ncbi:MAG: putative ABC transporter permease [Coriobacteriales bacterium]|jgi:uncharacterized membrane protein|nr:putative ABC transporter permease [Coriobacteriales bacterium]
MGSQAGASSGGGRPGADDAAGTSRKVVASLQRWFYYFLLCGIIGFVYENLLDNLWYHHPWQWQGPLHGPWLVIYSFGGLALLLALERFVSKKIKLGPIPITPILTVILIFLIVCVVEYIGHWFLDTFFDFRPWDYTDKPFNLNGRICLEDSLRFVVLGVLELYVILPLVERFLAKLTRRQNLILFLVAAGLFVFDIIYSVIVMI